MIWGITLILFSIIAVPSLFLSENLSAIIKIEPYQGWIGILFCFWGVLSIVLSLLDTVGLRISPIWWMTLLTGSLIEVVLGFGLINKFILSKIPKEEEKGIRLRAKLTQTQDRLGVIGLITGVWMVVASVLFL